MKNYALHLRPAPPLILAAALLLWGWQNNFVIYALLMALILEVAHWINWRWPVSDKEFNNLTDLSGIGFFIARAGQLLETEKVFAGLILLAILGLIGYQAIAIAEKRLLPWHKGHGG